MIGKLLLFSWLLAFVSVCKSADTEYVIPVSKQCESYVKSFIENENELLGMEGIKARLEYKRFDYADIEHPFIGGYVRLFGPISSQRSALLLNTITLMCYPNDRVLIDNIDMAMSGKVLAEKLNGIRKRNIDEIYIRYDGNDVQIFYRDEARLRGSGLFSPSLR